MIARASRAHPALPLGHFKCESFGHERLGDAPGDIVKPLDNAGFDGVSPQGAAARLCELLQRGPFNGPLPGRAKLVDRIEHGSQRAVDWRGRLDLSPRVDDA
jgi:hypothetical protein